jgi:hypothetical protein
VRGELVGSRTDAHRVERGARQHGNAVAALDMRLGRGEIPAVGKRRRQRLGELFVVGAGLLQADDIGGAFREPRQQAEVLRGSLLDRCADAVDVDGGDDHGGRP